MAISFTERAAAEVKRVKDDQKIDEQTFVRVGAVGGGCSGFQYQLYFDTNFDEQSDTRYECHGVSVVVDRKSQLLLDGTTVDWHEDLNRRGFKFENPNEVRSCGCGQSFQV